jgi:hypothetical protein
VPVYSDARPYVAHWAQTLDFYRRREDVSWFFQTTTADGERIELLFEEDVMFVVAGPAEAELADLATPPIIQLPVLHDGSTTVYESRDVVTGRQE